MTPKTIYRGTAYPRQCDRVGHMNIMWYIGKFDRTLRKSTAFAADIREAAAQYLVSAKPAIASGCGHAELRA
jgi:hypothetical protein